MRIWGRDVRTRRTGKCYLRLVDDPCIRDVRVKRSVPDHLIFDARTLWQRPRRPQPVRPGAGFPPSRP